MIFWIFDLLTHCLESNNVFQIANVNHHLDTVCGVSHCFNILYVNKTSLFGFVNETSQLVSDNVVDNHQFVFDIYRYHVDNVFVIDVVSQNVIS